MSAFSTVGAAVAGGIVMVAGIVTVETRPEPPSSIVVCENYAPVVDGFVAGNGCRQDGRTVQVIVADPSALQAP